MFVLEVEFIFVCLFCGWKVLEFGLVVLTMIYDEAVVARIDAKATSCRVIHRLTALGW